ncbi:MAG: response regulator [bacterium]|nr:response regulator [bacterium]
MARRTVLIVDDDPVFLEALSAVLKNEYEVLQATTGEDAVGTLAEQRPDLIVLDVMMSYPSEGYDLARMLKNREATSRIPIIMLTGVSKMFEARSRVEGSYMDCDSFMTKPPDFDKLRETINSLIERTEAGG